MKTYVDGVIEERSWWLWDCWLCAYMLIRLDISECANKTVDKVEGQDDWWVWVGSDLEYSMEEWYRDKEGR